MIDNHDVELEQVIFFIEELDLDIHAVDDHGNSYTMCLCYGRTGDKEASIIKLLLEKGADINIVNEYGDNALMISIGQIHTPGCDFNVEVDRLLIESGIDINRVNSHGRTVFEEFYYRLIE